jgi:broad specificity phosphatase PhoE
MRLILIRHGESHAFLHKIIADVESCKGLTELGIAQVQMLAKRLRSTGEVDECTTFLSSPVLRARQTADILLEVLPVASYMEEPNLRDLIPGEADGLAEEEYQARYGRFSLPEEPERRFAPGGESWIMFTTRVREAMARFAEQYAGQTVVAASHSGFIMMSILQLFAISRPGTQAYLNPTYTSLTEWRYSGTRWTLERYNDSSHLIGTR